MADEYALRDEPPARAVGPEPAPPPRDDSDSDEKTQRRELRELQEERAWEMTGRILPVRMLCSGTFGFPFRMMSLPAVVTLTMTGMVPMGMMLLAYAVIGGGGGGLGPMSALPLGAAVTVAAIGGIIGFAWVVILAIFGLTVLRDTACGGETIENWPNLLAMEGGSEVFYVIGALMLSGAAGSILASFAGGLGIPKAVTVGLGMAILFPLFLLSMLETGTAFNPISPPIWASVRHAWRAWGLFYLLASVAEIVILLLAQLAGAIGLRLGALGIGLAVVVSAFLTAAGAMIYFRLLGRLAWFCSGRWAWEDR